MTSERDQEPFEILRDDPLYRRLHTQSHIRKKTGTVSPAAFMYDGVPVERVSVDHGRLCTPRDSLARQRKPGWTLGELRAAVPMDLGLSVEHDPILDPPELRNPAHCLIVGLGPNDMTQCDILARNTIILPLPPTGSH